uniref:NADH-ubiquinone oxidoreductase chain 4L n=1 Tax=Bostrichoidea sp. 5 KM-2017 TaxID=2219279 RepID=A0A346RGQ9_9COLE|nr:NADH dehydrogenase subunit 4L [Bostrichoidea sp. 5 KM-2017]
MMIISSYMMFFMGLMSFSLNRKHLLLLLLSLEFLVIFAYFMLSNLLFDFSYEFFILMLFLIMSVCESALGLSVLVSLIRTHGSDFFNVFSFLW